MKVFILMCLLKAFLISETNAAAVIRHSELFKYNPADVYTLPEDIDDNDDKPATIFNGDVMKAKVEKLQSINGKNKFKLDLKTQNGIEVTSVGKLKDSNTFVVSGSYSFTGADGKRYRTRYTADEFGYHPITELELDIPELVPVQPAATKGPKSPFKFYNRLIDAPPAVSAANASKNKFQFLNQNFNTNKVIDPLRGSGQSGDDYSYIRDNSLNPSGNNNQQTDNQTENNIGNANEFDGSNGSNYGADDDDYYKKSGNGYTYNAPSIVFQAPSHEYLPPIA